MKTPGSGRKAGTPNKDKKSLLEKAEASGVDPFEFFCMTMKGDWKALGLKPKTKGGIKKGMEITPVVIEDPVIPFADRFSAAKELASYIYSKRSSVKISSDEESGFKIIIEDFSTKENK